MSRKREGHVTGCTTACSACSAPEAASHVFPCPYPHPQALPLHPLPASCPLTLASLCSAPLHMSMHHSMSSLMSSVAPWFQYLHVPRLATSGDPGLTQGCYLLPASRLSEGLEYSCLLDQAAAESAPVDRLMLVAVWVLTCYNSQVGALWG
jgi:hypothetical protein